MAHPMRQNGGLANLAQLHELTGLMADERVPHEDLEALLRKYRGGSAGDGSYASRFRRAINACGCDTNDAELTVETFPESVFGTLAKDGVTLAQPPISDAARKRGYWLDSEIDEWFAGADVKDKGLESCYLVDLAKYGEEHPEEQRTKGIVCWRTGKNGRIAYLGRSGSKRNFYVFRREDSWRFICWFPLRKVRQQAL